MCEHSKEAVIKVLGIDLAKRSFHLYGVDDDGQQVLSKKLTQARLGAFVAVKTIEQQDVQAIHRLRNLTVDRRTAQINQIRGLLLEYGIEVAQGRAAMQRRLPEILEDADNGLSARFRAELHGLAEELRHLNERVAHYDAQIDAIAQGDRQARELMTIPGIGAKGATALLAAVGEDPTLFSNGRALAAWIGLVPRQHSTGGRERLLAISKRGDVCLCAISSSMEPALCCVRSSARRIAPVAGPRR